MSSPLYLFRTRRFAPLFGTQFLGAFNDNLFKNTLAIILTFQSSEWTSLPLSILAPLIGALFILPFFLFSGFSGELADRLDKARLARLVKLWELLLMIGAIGGFYLHSFPLLLGIVFALGLHSTLFGPIKYSILPQHMKANELIGANALVESGTFMAILLGTIAGGVLSSYPQGGIIASLLGTMIALIGYLFSRFIPSAPAYDTTSPFSLNIIAHTVNTIRLVYRTKILWYCVLAISWFWLYGALFLTQFPAYVKTVLGGGEQSVTLLLIVFTLGIGIGSMVCERLSAHMVRPSFIILGAVGMSVFGIDFAMFSGTELWRILIDLTMIGAFGGLYSVPLYTLLQQKSDEGYRSRTIAANNIFNALFMVAGSIGVILMLSHGYSVLDTFWYAAVLSAIIAVGLAWKIKKLTA